MNQRLLFFTKINFGHNQNAGYLNKVRSQSQALREHGWEVDLIYIFNNEVRIENPEGTSSKAFSSRLKLLYYLFIGFPREIKKGKYYGVYIRHFLTTPLFLRFLQVIKPKVTKLVMEVPTFPYSFEYKAWNKNKLLFLLDQLCSGSFKKYIDRIVSFSFDKKIFGIPTISTDNGVDVKTIPYNPIPPEFDRQLNILGLGNPRIWHGYERILYGLEKYYSDIHINDIYFHIVGSGGEIDKYKDLCVELKLEDKVIFHGYQTGESLNKICGESHIAVASMGMHRINVANGEASPLKAREFAARGLPFITGYKDKGFPKVWPFIFNCSSNESPVNLNLVLDWYLDLIDKYPQFPEVIRKYAEENLDWAAKMKPVSDYLKQDPI